MTTVTIGSGVISIGSANYASLDYEAKNVGDEIIIHHKTSDNDIICQGPYTDLDLNGAGVAPNAVSFVYAFNLYIIQYKTTDAAGIPADVADILSEIEDININSEWPDTLISVNITPDVKTPITLESRPGSVVLQAPSANTGVIYIGLSGVVGAGSFELEASQSIPIEFDRLASIWVKNSVGGEKVNVIGSFKS